jgi:hypothetical protein
VGCNAFEAWAKRAVRRRSDAVALRWTGVFPPAATYTGAIFNVRLTSTPAGRFARQSGPWLKALRKSDHRIRRINLPRLVYPPARGQLQRQDYDY